jgi:tRNA(Ile)-lysidine synthetase-like protein
MRRLFLDRNRYYDDYECIKDFLSMSEQKESFLQRFIDAVDSFTEAADGCGLLLSLSAGKDSMALFRMMCAIKDERHFRIGVFHLNHCMRGEESDADERFLSEQCRSAGVAFHPFRHQFENTSSFEEKARAKRYELSENLRAAEKYDFIATAHTANDNVETVLMRLFTGTHISGLRGIPHRRDHIIRPLLWATSDEVYGYLRGNGFPWREDASNADESYARNFIRHRIVPLIETRFPRAVSSVSDCSSAAGDHIDLVETLLRHAGIGIQRNVSGCGVSYHELLEDANVFNYIAAELLKETGQFASGEKLSEMRKRFLSVRSRIVLYESPDCEIVSDRRSGTPGIFARRKNQAENDLSVGIWSAEIMVGEQDVTVKDEKSVFPIRAELVSPESVKDDDFASPDVLFIDVSCVDRIDIRSVRHGDRMVCSGISRKLKNLMIDNKCSPDEKKAVPLLVSKGEIIAAGFGFVRRGNSRIADEYMVTGASKKVLALHRVYLGK